MKIIIIAKSRKCAYYVRLNKPDDDGDYERKYWKLIN
jgi:hypothetical protein